MRWYLLDLETGGLKPSDGVVEVGFFELDENAQIIDRVESLIDPGTGAIAPSASGVHGITIDMVENSPTLEEFFSSDDPTCYGKPLQGDPPAIIGHKISYDVAFVKDHIEGTPLELCTLRWSRSLYPHSDSHTLSTLRYALNLAPPSGVAHRVLYDVSLTYELLLHIMERTNLTLPELTAKSQEPMLVTFVPFGKHKGQLYSEVPRSYLQWMQRELKDLDIDQSYTINYYLNK